jgi:hypothetical protein
LERRLVSITRASRRDRPTAEFLSSACLLAAAATLIVAAGVPVSASPRDIGSVAATPRGVVTLVDGRSHPGRADAPAFTLPGAANSRGPTSSLGRETAAPDAGEVAETSTARAADTNRANADLKTATGAARPPSEQAQAPAPPLPEYGWELRQPGRTLQIASPAGLSPTARLDSPAAAPDSKERTGRPKWARFVPQLAVPGKGGRPASSLAERKLMLSVSVDMGAP